MLDLKLELKSLLSEITAQVLEHLYSRRSSDPVLLAAEDKLMLLLEPHDWAIKALISSNHLSVYDQIFAQELDRMVQELMLSLPDAES